MSCNVCENEYGYTNGCDCSFLMCENCSKKICEKKDKCPQCKKSLRTTYFLSGKIEIERRSRDEDRLIVYDDEVETPDDVMCRGVAGSKHGIIEIWKDQLIKYSDFINVDKPLKNVKLNDFVNVSGPGIIINGEVECMHGSGVNGDYDDWSELYRDISQINGIVEKRNKEMIDRCDVFSLKVNSASDCYCSFSEWGYALSNGKVLVLDIQPNHPSLKEFYMFAIQSLKSFENLKFTRKYGIIKYHPRLKNMNYNSYKNLMETIISAKHINPGKH